MDNNKDKYSVERLGLYFIAALIIIFAFGLFYGTWYEYDQHGFEKPIMLGMSFFAQYIVLFLVLVSSMMTLCRHSFILIF